MSGAATAPSPLPRGGAPLDTPPAAPEAMDEAGRAFEFERVRSIVRHELFQEAMGAMSRLGEELAGTRALRMKVSDWRRNGAS